MMTTQDQPRNDLALAEAALFLAPQPLTRRALAKILGGVALPYVDQLLEDLKAQFDDSSRGIELHIEEGHAMFRVKAALVNQVAHLAPQQDVPRPVLRTLAVIAYNHPMTQADLIKVRGNKGYGHVRELIERHLITAEEHGRTLLLSVTKDFLRHFGLSSVEEFRFHFAASPEEDPADDSSQSADSQTDQSDVSEVMDFGEIVNVGEVPDVSDAGNVTQGSDSGDEDPERPPIEMAKDLEPQEADKDSDPSASDGTVENEDEPKEEPSEEVQDG